jgi:hypothetical protein
MALEIQIKNNVGEIAIIHKYEASLSIILAKGLAKKNIIEVPKTPKIKKTDKAPRNIRSTCYFLALSFGVLEIIIVIAVGNPAVETRYKVVKMLYAILKYPMP